MISVGLPFLVVELGSRDALRRSKPDIAAQAALLPLDAADAVFAYWRAPEKTRATVLHARTFAPLDGVIEDPATGSACAAAITLLATLESNDARTDSGAVGGRTQRAWRIHQGVDMGRPSLLLGRTTIREGTVSDTFIGGRCVAVLEGSLLL